MTKTIEIKMWRWRGSPMEELRDYGVGAQILAELGIHDMILLTNTHHSLVALEGYGLHRRRTPID
jgi:3,4-dihydroxy 2-butanone 4-phosphate synthase/GTP cyclohydrolase II